MMSTKSRLLQTAFLNFPKKGDFFCKSLDFFSKIKYNTLKCLSMCYAREIFLEKAGRANERKNKNKRY